MANDGGRDEVRREVLPIPDKPPVGLTTYDAKDPDTRCPPIVPLRPPEHGFVEGSQAVPSGQVASMSPWPCSSSGDQS